MPRILCKYVLREVIPPTVLALCAITFISLSLQGIPDSDEKFLLMLLRLMAREDVGAAEVIMALALAIPSLVMAMLPMAFLIGIVIGVGRLTLDLEIRAMEATGVNIFRVFAPVLILGFLMSLGVAIMSYSAEPRMLKQSFLRVGNLLVAELSNLEAGRVYDNLFDDKMSLHFDRKGEDMVMEGVTLIVDPSAMASQGKKDKTKKERRERESAYKRKLAIGEIDRETYDRKIYEIKIDDQSESPMMILAEKAELSTEIDKVKAEGKVLMELTHGTIHILDSPKRATPKLDEVALAGSFEESGPALPLEEIALAEPLVDGGGLGEGAADYTRDYAIVHFGKFSRQEPLPGTNLKRERTTKTVPELLKTWRNETEKPKYRYKFKATILERFSLSLQCLVFAILGLPLAVYVRPTGKSIGLVLAFALILVYQAVEGAGRGMIETTEASQQTLGAFVIFLPNLAFAAIGALLWWRVLKR